jgi:hypothetical protein
LVSWCFQSTSRRSPIVRLPKSRQRLMQILFDQGVPAPLKAFIESHVDTCYERGWSHLSNGELIAKAESQYDVFIRGGLGTGYLCICAISDLLSIFYPCKYLQSADLYNFNRITVSAGPINCQSPKPSLFIHGLR